MFDMHCHLIYGVDDGANTIKDSLAMLKAARGQGITRIVCTPHCRWDDWSPALIQQHYEELVEPAAQLGITLDLGSEVNWKKLSEIGIDQAPKLTLGDTNLFLLELSDSSMPPNWQRFIYKLQGMGLQVIIAHPERYRDIQNNLEIAQDLHDMGCYLQLSANFIDDSRFDKRRKTATALLRADLVDYLASDAHTPEDYQLYAKALQFARTH